MKVTTFFFKIFAVLLFFSCSRKVLYTSSFSFQKNISYELKNDSTKLDFAANYSGKKSEVPELEIENEIDSSRNLDIVIKENKEELSDILQVENINYYKNENILSNQKEVKDGRKVHRVALIGFIFALLEIVFFPIGLVAFVLGIIGLHKIKKYNTDYRGKGYAITAIVLGSLAILYSIIGIIIIFIFFGGGIA